jgi:precorrin-2 dehydrogenase / sirohydrochlorin ferrochelatase
MALFPMFLKLAGRPCLVVGAGRVAESKIQGLLAAGAAVCAVGPRATRQIRKWAHEGKLSWVTRNFDPGDLDGVLLVVASAPPEINNLVFWHARRRGVLCNVVDDPQRCDFYYPAIMRRGDLQIAISTGGKSPALAQRLRKQLERQFGAEYEAWVEQLGNKRQKLFKQDIDPDRRRRLLHELASGGPSRGKA